MFNVSSGQSEVHQLDVPRRVHHDVFRLEVSADDASLVQVVDSHGDLGQVELSLNGES